MLAGSVSDETQWPTNAQQQCRKYSQQLTRYRNLMILLNNAIEFQCQNSGNF